MTHIHVRYLQSSLKKGELKDGQHNQPYKKGNEKMVVHRPMHQKTKGVVTRTKIPLKTRDECIC